MMNQPVLNISNAPSGKSSPSPKVKEKGMMLTAFQNLVLGLSQEETGFEGQIQPPSGRGGNPTGWAQKNLPGQSLLGTNPSKIPPQEGMGGTRLLSHLQGTQPKAATVLISLPSPKKSIVGITSLRTGYPEATRPQEERPDGQNSTPSQTASRSQPDRLMGLTPVLRGQRALKFNQTLSESKFPKDGPGKTLGLDLPPANLKSQMGAKREAEAQVPNYQKPERPLPIFKFWSPHSEVNRGSSLQPPFSLTPNKTQIRVEEASPSKLILTLPSPQGEGPLRLEINLSQVDSFLNRVAPQSLEQALGLRSEKAEITAKTEMGPNEELQLNISWKKGRIIGDIIAPNQNVQKMIKEFLPQIKKAFNQVGVKIDSLRVSSSPYQRGASKQANSKTSSSHFELPQKEETKTSKMSFPSGPMKVETPSIPNRPSLPSFHHVKDLDGLIDQLIQKLKVNLQAGKSEATVALKPDYLGHLQIRLTLDGKNISGKIMVDNPLAKNLIQTSLPHLKDSLTNLGIQVQDLDVFVGERFPSSQKRETSQGRKSQFPSSTRPILPADPLYPLLGVNMAAQGGVDYLA